MKIFHHIRIRVICKPEKQDEITQKVKNFIATQTFEKFVKTEVHNDDEFKSTILTFWIKQQKLCKQITKNIYEHIEDKKSFIDNLENRIDEQTYLYFRLKKDEFPKLQFTNEGNCIHISIKIAAYPKKVAVAARVARHFFQQTPYSNT